jgi:hypothetical protein
MANRQDNKNEQNRQDDQEDQQGREDGDKTPWKLSFFGKAEKQVKEMAKYADYGVAVGTA